MSAPRPVSFGYVDTPVGRLGLAGTESALTAIDFPLPGRTDARRQDEELRMTAILDEAARQLASYFAGRLRAFDLPLAPEGTAFQLAVWRALAEIPYGATVSYADLAARVGRPRAVRAVGLANGRNPLPIVLPCHRVIGSNGKLTGYGGGLGVKAYLLALERGEAAFW